MEIIEARKMIETGIPTSENSLWVDLGCGAGTFTYALAGLLKTSNKIIAIDRQLQKLEKELEGCEIEFRKSNIESDPFSFQQVNGILMANSLHYVRDQSSFIKKLKNQLTKDGRIILVEYDTETSNQWVPFPVSFNKAQKLFCENGFKAVKKIGERKSVYNSGLMYASLIA